MLPSAPTGHFYGLDPGQQIISSRAEFRLQSTQTFNMRETMKSRRRPELAIRILLGRIDESLQVLISSRLAGKLNK